MTEDISKVLNHHLLANLLQQEPVLDDGRVTSLLETSMQLDSHEIPHTILQAMTTRGFYLVKAERQKVYLRDAVKQGHMLSLMFPEPTNESFAETLKRFRSFPKFSNFATAIGYIAHVYQFPGVLRLSMIAHINRAWNSKEHEFPGVITSMTKTM